MTNVGIKRQNYNVATQYTLYLCYLKQINKMLFTYYVCMYIN